MAKKRIAVVGLGRLGAPLAAFFASRGMEVVGVDVDPLKVEAMNRLEASHYEPGLDQLLKTSKGNLRATQSLKSAVVNSEATFIIVPTPSTDRGHFSLEYVTEACETIGRTIGFKNEYHLVVLASTVSPGSTGGMVRRVLENSSGKRIGRDFGLCYSPLFVALGSVVRDLYNLDFILMGQSDGQAGSLLKDIYKDVLEDDPTILRMNFINAELTKLALNTFLTTKISFANMLARICERLPGADVDVVTGALGLDHRIGPAYLKGGISYGGPCFPRDNAALAALAHSVGAPAEIALTTDSFNRWQIGWLADMVESRLNQGGTAGILGLTYKPSTFVLDDAPGFLLFKELVRREIQVRAYDPIGMEEAIRLVGSDDRFARSPAELIRDVDLVVVTTAWPEFSDLPPDVWAGESAPRTVIDCWRILPFLEGARGVNYLGLGRWLKPHSEF